MIHEGRPAAEAYRGLLRRGRGLRAARHGASGPRPHRAPAPWCCAGSWGGCASPTTSSATCRRSSASARPSRSSCPASCCRSAPAPCSGPCAPGPPRRSAPTGCGPTGSSASSTPRSPGFVPRGHLPFLTNVTHRNWTAVGNLDSPWEAIVDPRGLVTPWFDGWSLDWWIGADDRWHLPSREVGRAPAAGRRRAGGRDGDAGPGGDAVAAGLRGAAQLDRGRRRAGGRRDRERSRRCPSPWPWPCGRTTPRAWRSSSASTCTTAPRSRSTAGWRCCCPAARPGGGVDVPRRRLGRDRASAGDAGERWRGPVRDPAGLAQAAFVFPLAHGATLRVAIPLVPERRTRRRGGRPPAAGRRARASRRRCRRPRPVAAGLAGAERRGACGSCCPTSGWPTAVDANRRFLLLLHDGDEITPGPVDLPPVLVPRRRLPAGRPRPLRLPRRGRRGAALVPGAPARRRLLLQPARRSGTPTAPPSSPLAEHWRLTRDAALVEPMVGTDRQGRALDRAQAARPARPGGTTRARGLLPAGVSAEHLGPFDYFYWDDFWGVAGLRAGAELLRAVGSARRRRRRRRDSRRRCGPTSSASLAADRRAAGHRRHPGRTPAPHRRRRHRLARGVHAARPAAAGRPPHRRHRRCHPRAVHARGRAAAGTARMAEVGRSSRGSATPGSAPTSRCSWRLSSCGPATGAASTAWPGCSTPPRPTWTWPEAIHPRLDGGCMGDGHHGWAAAELLTFVRDLLVREVAGGAGAGVAGARRLVRPGLGGARRPDRRRPRLLRGALARRPGGAAVGGHAASRRRRRCASPPRASTRRGRRTSTTARRCSARSWRRRDRPPRRAPPSADRGLGGSTRAGTGSASTPRGSRSGSPGRTSGSSAW